MIAPGVRTLALALAACATSIAFASGSPVYKWKDADGGLHFTDTPPPTGALLIKGPRPQATRPADTPPLPSRSDISPKDCEQARQALSRDLEEIDEAGLVAADAEAQRAREDQQAAALKAHECGEQKQMLSVLKRRQRGESTETLSADERAGLPASIADIERRLAERCL